MKILSLSILTAAFFFTSGLANAKSNTAKDTSGASSVERHVSDFDGLKVEGPIKVILVQGQTQSVRIEGPAQVLDSVITEVVGGTLEIHLKHPVKLWGERSIWKNSWWQNNKHIVAYVTAKDLSRMSTSGSSTLLFEHGFKASTMSIEVHGSGHLEGKLETTTLTSHISGSGHIRISGSAENTSISVSGSGKFSGLDLISANASAHVSGSGHVEFNASKKIDASVHGSGHVGYTGTASDITVSKSGSGHIGKI